MQIEVCPVGALAYPMTSPTQRVALSDEADWVTAAPMSSTAAPATWPKQIGTQYNALSGGEQLMLPSALHFARLSVP